MNPVAVEAITDRVLASLDREGIVDPSALTFLLRQYGHTDRSDLRAALEPALTRALDLAPSAQAIPSRAAWLFLFAESLTLSLDVRLQEVAAALAGSLRLEWGRGTDIEAASLSVDACLRACAALELPSVAPEAVDELERIVAASYRPGYGLSRGAQAHASGGSLQDYMTLSSALLTAFEMSGRLPYSMLAEELVQFARRMMWREGATAYDPGDISRSTTFAVNCEAARVLCRLARLHRDESYRAAAVIRSDAAYADDAERILTALGAALEQQAEGSAIYGLALTEWLSLG